MDSLLSQLGVGALLAWTSLPVFARLVRPRAPPDARTLHRAQVAVLLGAVGLLSLPWLPSLPGWLAPSGPYYQFEMRAILVPAPRPPPFGPRAAAAVLSPIALVGAFWLIAVAIALTRTALGAHSLARLLRAASPAPSALVELLRARATEAGIRAPALLVSERSAIPFATGLWRPAIVLPRELADTLDGQALALVLEHELEHVRRSDPRVAAFVSLLKLVLGGHPTAEKLAREAVLAREIAVDARVSQRSPRAYATLLVDIAAHAHFGEKPASSAIDDTALARRIALISEPVATRPLSLLPLLAAGTAVVLCTVLANTFVSWTPAPPAFVGPGAAAPGARPLLLAARSFGFGAGPIRPPGTHAFRPMPDVPHRLHAAPPEPRLPELLHRAPEVQACWAEASKVDPDAHPHVRFAIDVGSSGVPTLSVMASSAPEFAGCLERVVSPMLREQRLPSGANFVIGLDLSAPPLP